MTSQATTPDRRLRARAAAVRSGALHVLLRKARAWWKVLMRRRSARRDELFLLSQPDHILRDIGIGRSEIEFAVRGHRRR